MKTNLILLIVFLGSTAFAGTLDQVKTADCTSDKGSFLKIDVEKEMLSAKITSLPELSNLTEGERMPLEIQKSDGYTTLGGLVVNAATGVFGSVVLATLSDKDVAPQATLLAVFRDMTGKVEKESLTCSLTGI